MQLVRYARAQDELMRTPPSHAGGPRASIPTAARAIIAAALAAGRTMLSEVEAKALLAAYGIPDRADRSVARDADEVGRARRALDRRDYGACVVKILSDDISHKSDVGGVRLGLEHRRGGARGGARTCSTASRALMPKARIEGFTVQPHDRPAATRTS